MKKYAIIPARGGSKRIHRKNIKNFNGKPLILWTLGNLLSYQMFDEIIVSTDDKEVANTCNFFNVKVLDNRPSNLSNDLSPTLPVIKFVLENYLELADPLDEVVCIYPGAVLLEKNDLVAAKNLFIKNNNRFVIAATKYSHPIQRSFIVDEKKDVLLSNSKLIQQRTQDLEHYFHDAGQFYWGTKKLWKSSNSILENCAAIEIPNSRIQDIDTPEDWERIEIMHKIALNKFKNI
jgi:pseudaminic acid cytidylyltransferase